MKDITRFADLLPGVVQVQLTEDRSRAWEYLDRYIDGQIDRTLKAEDDAIVAWFKEGTGDKVTVEWKRLRI
jgi:hypothetical protein